MRFYLSDFKTFIHNMKKSYIFYLSLCIALASSFNLRAQAQNWTDFGAILSQLDSAKRADYLRNLVSLQNAAKLGLFDFSPAMDSLNLAAGAGIDPTTGLNTQLPSITLGRDTLEFLLNGANLSSLDSLSILNEYDFLTGVWTTRSDSLYQVFENNSAAFDNANLINGTGYPVTQQQYGATLDSSKVNLLNGFTNSQPNGVGNVSSSINQLFSPQNFTQLEIFGGRQSATAAYYRFAYEVNVPVIGVRSVEQFDRTWEPRWRAQGSWFIAEPQFSGENSDPTLQKNTPFMFNGNFDMMYNPEISSGVRLITLMGVDMATYAPQHRNSAIPATLDNRGFTTGWGPVIGAGLATTIGGVTVYGLSTLSYGDVVQPNAALTKYRYRSSRIEAGIRLANAATLRYEIGLSNNWANDGNKHVRYNQITVGLPTSGLFH
jgi:hypothetical protein